MAVNNTQASYSNMEFPLSMKRQDAFALDQSEVWPSLEAAQDYAKNNPTAYVGQVISVVSGGVSTVYQIKNEGGELEPLGGGSVSIATDAEVEEMFNEVFSDQSEQGNS
jgi:hypothetical protein